MTIQVSLGEHIHKYDSLVLMSSLVLICLINCIKYYFILMTKQINSLRSIFYTKSNIPQSTTRTKLVNLNLN